MNFPTPEEIAEMKARGFDRATIEAAELQSKRGDAARMLCDKIRQAFAGVLLGNGVGLQQGQGLDDYDDEETCTTLRAADEKEDWQRITSELLNGCYSSLSFFDAEGMRFHLPAFLIADLNGECDVGLASTLSRLSDYSKSKFELLSSDQIVAVREYLELALEDPDYWFDRPDIETALEDCWGSGLADEEV